MVTKAAVLCGGEGTRLRPLSNYFQKTMIPIGTARKPLLEYIVRLLGYNGIRDITLLTGYRSEEIEKFFGDGSNLGLYISYSKDPEGMKGSAGSLANAVGQGNLQSFDNLVVYYGDVLSAMDIRGLVAQHEARRSALTLALSRDYKVPVGVANVESDRVKSFREKPMLPLNVTVGCLVISRDCIPILRKAVVGPPVPDIMTHFVPLVIESGMLVSPFYIDGFWYDVGTTEAYEKLDSEMVERNLKFLG